MCGGEEPRHWDAERYKKESGFVECKGFGGAGLGRDCAAFGKTRQK
jgi:hypothetical protein